MNKSLFEELELEKEIEQCKKLNIDVIKIKITTNPVEWICKSNFNENALEILTETKGISRDDIKRIFDKHLEKPLNEMMEELTKISSEFFMKMLIEEAESSNEWH